MDSRRQFLKKALTLAVGGGVAGALPASIQRAFAIDPVPGSSYSDAEHVVILMQENRSFDHAFGTLQGVRGFADPRSMTLADGNPVWLQSNAAGETYAPFRLDIKDTNATWMGSLPHGRQDQLAARNHGRHNGWLDAKKNGNKDFAHVPLTLGYYTREDIPFYYALADAFTICDQNFCSSLTPTIPNRLHLWTGTIRGGASIETKARVNNDETYYDSEASWKTFPERLEELGVSWRVYQNDISLHFGMKGEHEAWLANFEDNPLEWFTQYRVRFSPNHQAWLRQTAQKLAADLEKLHASSDASSKVVKGKIAAIGAEIEKIQSEMIRWSDASFSALSTHEQNLHRKAFTTNRADPDFRELAELTYQEGGAERRMQIPKGDVLRQFRKDVESGNLPVVSWLVPAERLSDHPSSAWYGAWYLSEAFDILTRNPDVWKKTIFILCYDENDGYFDHVPPFVAPDPNQAGAGKVSAGIDASLEYVSQKQGADAGPIGLGYRVPLVIASPWSRGGCVCSQVFDHTSILMFLEKFLSAKIGRPVGEANITEWRRTVCGDLTSVFRPCDGESIPLPHPIERAPFFESIHDARAKPEPATYRKFSPGETAQLRNSADKSAWLAQQEKGSRPSSALPYELAVDGSLSPDRKSFVIEFAAGNKAFGARSAGSPFYVYTPVKWKNESESGRAWNYAVAAGDRVSDTWNLEDFPKGICHLRAHGPNGFYREFYSGPDGPSIEISLTFNQSDGVVLTARNRDSRRVNLLIEDISYGNGRRELTLGEMGAGNDGVKVTLDLTASHFWYDFRISVAGGPAGTPGFWQRYAGRVETGHLGATDPLIGA